MKPEDLHGVWWYMNFYLTKKLRDTEAGLNLINELIERLDCRSGSSRGFNPSLKTLESKYSISWRSLVNFNQHLMALLTERRLIKEN